MPVSSPLGVNYPSPLIGVPSLNQDEPREGRQMIPCEILWSSFLTGGKTVNFNLQGDSTLEWSQISALQIDNSASSVPVTFTFQDTGLVIVAPTGAKFMLIPVFSNSLQFAVTASTAIASDITRFKILNFPILPVYVA